MTEGERDGGIAGQLEGEKERMGVRNTLIPQSSVQTVAHICLTGVCS